jgi:hypothetical protein
MNIEGLKAILGKEEIVPTRQAQDFLQNSQDIDDLYKHHVRSYTPLQTGSDEASGVAVFAAKFIRQVKDARAPRGYITADFGYGKTSAGLFVWQKAQDAHLIAVPPFRLNRLEDLLDATAGWVAYVLDKNVPHLVAKVVEIYNFYHNRELESIASRYGVTLEQAERMYKDQALQLSITPKDIVRFFVQLTELVCEAGFEGLVVIPDELQQYLEPEIKSGKIDPLVPLFDIITELMNQQGSLAFGFLMIITSKELGAINDQRGDLIDRLRGNTLDLRAIYDREFAARLWYRFAETFDYEAIASQVVDSHTLESLGQIASRQDLSNGPRTVINAFRRIARHAVEAQGQITPYTPIDLVEDFLANRIAFDARKILQEAANKALSASLVRGNLPFERSIKLLAAFPMEGASREVQAYYGLAEACAELKVSGSPEIVVEIGDRHNPALMLRGLDAAQENMDELSLILTEFVRNFEPYAANQMERAVNSFMSLLTLVFKAESWSTAKSEQRTFASNAKAVFVGTFSEMARRFPERTIHVCVLSDDEREIQSNSEGECHLYFVLNRHFDLLARDRQNVLGEHQLNDSEHTAIFSLNLSLLCFDNLNRATQDQLRRIIDPDQVTVLTVLALYAFLQSAAERDGVSKLLREMIKRSISVRLLEGALEVLFNPAVGAAFSVNGGRVIEKVVEHLIETRYGDQYHTLITYKQWRDNLRSYISALKQLPSFAQKQGFATVEGTKDEIARYFSTTAASFDTFQSRFPELVQIEGGSFPSRGEIKSGRKGGVKFTRHIVEESILANLSGAVKTVKRDGKEVKVLRVDAVYHEVSEQGYRKDEIEFILDIMKARDLIEIEGGWIWEKQRPTISTKSLAEQVQLLKQEAKLLHQASENPAAQHVVQQAEHSIQRLKALSQAHKESELVLLDEQIQTDRKLIQTLIDHELGEVNKKAARLRLGQLPSDWESTLSTMIRAGKFNAALNHVRLQYEQMLRQWNRDAAAYQESVSELNNELGQLTLISLQRFTGRINQLSQKQLALTNQRGQLEQAVDYTQLWQTVSNQLIVLLETTQKLGDPARPMLESLQIVENRIATDFTKNAAETYKFASTYQRELVQLEKQIEGFASQAERKFDREQEFYRNLLIQKAGVKLDNLWRKIIYSPNNPDGVYANLYEAVDGQIGDLIDGIWNDIEKSQNALLSLQTMSDNLTVSSTQLSEIEAFLGQLNNQFTELTEQITPANTHYTDRFEKWLDKFVQLRQNLRSVQQRIHQLRETPQPPKLSSDEQRLLVLMSQPNASNDLIRVRQAFTHLNDDVFWATVRVLWEKQLISITLKPVD